MCSSIDCCTRRNHINIHVCSFDDCCRDKLFKSSSSCFFDAVSVSSRKSRANLIFILAIVTPAATKLAFPLHTTWSITSERLGHVSSSTQVVVVQAYLQILTMPVHQAGISFSWPPAPCLDSLY